ncbi:DNA helicase PIF1, ATP-dependent [Tanacetum coccineum]
MASLASSIFIFIVKSLQFEHSAFPRLSAAPESPKEELAREEEIEGVEGNPAFSKLASKVATMSGSTQPKALLLLDQLDVNAVTGRYLSTNFGSIIHCSAKSSMAHNFLRMKEGGIYSVKNFVVIPNKYEFRIFRHDRFMIEFDGETWSRKVSADPHGFLRYPFRLLKFDQVHLPITNIAEYVTNVGRTSYTKTRSKTLEFYLENQRGQSLREYNNKLYLSSTSSTVFCDDDDIPCLQELRADDRKGVSRKNGKWVCEACNRAIDYPVFRYRLEVVVADDTAHTVVVMFNDTATELLKCLAESLMGTEDEGSDADDDLNLPLAIRNLIGTTHVLEIKSHTYYEYGTFESFNCWNINPSEIAEDDDSSSTPAVTANNAELSEKIVTKSPTVCTPLKTIKARKQRDEVYGPSVKKGTSTAAVAVDTIKKRKRRIDDESETNFNCWKINPGETAVDDASSSTPAVTANDVLHCQGHAPVQEFKSSCSHNNQRITPSLRGLHQNPVTIHANTIVGPDGRIQSTMNTVLHNNQNISPCLPDLLRYPISTHVNTIIGQDEQIQSTMNIASCNNQSPVSCNNQMVIPSFPYLLQNSVRIDAHTAIRQDGRLQSYCGLRLIETNTEYAGINPLPFPNSDRLRTTDIAGPSTSKYASTRLPRRSAGPMHLRMAKKRTKKAAFTSTGGKILLPHFHDTPPSLNHLLSHDQPLTAKFREQIRVYNSMFCFTSFGAKIDHSINKGRAPYTFRISGQNYHMMGSLLPKEGMPPRFAQLYFFDTQNEVKNRTSAFIDKETSEGIDKDIVGNLISMLDQYSPVAQSFRMARDWGNTHDSPDFRLRLHNERKTTRQYNSPTVSEVAAIIINDFRDAHTTRDIIVDQKDTGPQRVSELHPSYMALQYPLLFPYGEDGFHEKIPYYSNGGRLFQQYLVDAYTAVEEQRLKWTRNNQDTLRVDLYHNLCDAVTRGDTSEVGLGKRIILPRTFTRSPSDPDGYKVVTDYMLHGPCGKDARNAACTGDGKCSKHFAKPFLEETFLDEDGYPNYRQRDNKVTFKKGNFIYDNKHVVPHNRYLLNKRDPDARNLTYADIPKHYVWHEQSKMWKKRKQRKCIGRIVYSSPASGERYYLRMLLNIVRGVFGFEELMMIKKRVCATFKEACFEYGLLHDEKEWSYAIAEASLWALGPQLPDIFVTMLTFSYVRRPQKLWEESWQTLSEDILAKKTSLADFKDLPEPDPKLLTNMDNHLIREALDFDIKKSRVEHQHLHSLLNHEQ